MGDTSSLCRHFPAVGQFAPRHYHAHNQRHTRNRPRTLMDNNTRPMMLVPQHALELTNHHGGQWHMATKLGSLDQREAMRTGVQHPQAT